MTHARVDHSVEKTFRSFLSPDLPILDDLGLHRLDHQQSIDLYELVIARHCTASTVITSNRSVEEWLGLFDAPILAGSALDRLASASYQIVVEGESFRQWFSNQRALLEQKDVLDPPTAHQHPTIYRPLTWSNDRGDGWSNDPGYRHRTLPTSQTQCGSLLACRTAMGERRD
ncbi:MAG: ATP-binding protein [Chloroflexi bacterium]|nr:ATP-binding protein [Chloroflexota bacterium]